jgi:two-component system sensor histidine kinase HydH
MASTSQSDPAGEMARKIAHELNSPLDGVMRFVSLAQRKLNDKNQNPADIARYLADAEFGLQRIAEILRDLTEVTHAPLLDKSKSIQLAELIEQVIATHKPPADLCRVAIQVDPIESRLVDPRLYQVLSNLIKNAIEAMPAGGTIKISTQSSALSPEPFSISIADTGPGISPHHQQQLFESNFSTKSPNRGTGLALSREILKKIGGTLTLQNRPGGIGCEAIITIPVA